MPGARPRVPPVTPRPLAGAVGQGVTQPLNPECAGRAWFGALNEMITDWVLLERPDRLEDTYAALRPLLMRSVGAVNPSDRTRVMP